MATNKGFIKDWLGNKILPITRGELVLDSEGNIALNSNQFLAENGHPGLVTAAERAMINGSLGGEGSLSDIYDKINYINNGLKVGDTIIHFYSESEPTPIKLNSSGDNKIEITVSDDNSINLGLSELPNSAITANSLIKGLVVDKFGRVTSVTPGDIESSDLPDTITGKVITNSTLTGCYTTEVSDNATSLVNKEYVDAKFSEASGVAAGGLQFGGILNSSTVAVEKLTATYVNHYFKVTSEFTLQKSYFYEPSDILGDSVNLKIGDTLITYKPINSDYKFVYIPSADDITTISIRKENPDNTITNVLSYEIGNVILKFSSVFDIINSSSGTASITLPIASATKDGYLSKDDWNKFNSYSSSLGVSYVGNISSGPGVYELGTLTIGGIESVIYGKNNISSLSLQVASNNPVLKFTESGSQDVSISLQGKTGIKVSKVDDGIEFESLLSVPPQLVPDSDRTANYLTLNTNH
jgi:hypothetical protein